MDNIPVLVASLKKDQSQVPHNSEIAKVGVPSENFKNRTKTMYMTANSISGFSTDHRTPRKEP